MPYYRETEDGIHVFRRRWLGPARAFGYISLCESHKFPVEGKHFEIQEVEEAEIICEACLRLNNPDNETRSGCDKWGVSQGHIIGFSRGQEGEIMDVQSLCREEQFETIAGGVEEFEGNLCREEESVCGRCWSLHKERQWKGRDKGMMIRVVAETDSERKTFHAESINAGSVNSGETGYWLHSKDGLVKKLREDQVLEIGIVPERQVDY